MTTATAEPSMINDWVGHRVEIDPLPGRPRRCRSYATVGAARTVDETDPLLWLVLDHGDAVYRRASRVAKLDQAATVATRGTELAAALQTVRPARRALAPIDVWK